jgi:pyruvate dehydrogenase (quinone)/pyruvate oxidase
VPDDSPYTTGGVGLLGTRPSQDALESCDILFIVGSSFPYLEFYPRAGQARGVQLDIGPQRIGLRYPVEEGLVGESRLTLQALLPLLARKSNRKFLDHAQSAMRDWRQFNEELATRDDSPMKPQVVAWEFGKRLRDDAIIACDSGTITTWWARNIPAKRGQMHSVSGTLASMACGLPYAIAAQVAYPERQVVAFVGDGGFTMLMGELATAVKYELPIKVVVVMNNYLGQIKWEQMVFLGNPESPSTCSRSTLRRSPRRVARPVSASTTRRAAEQFWIEPWPRPAPWSSKPSSTPTSRHCRPRSRASKR